MVDDQATVDSPFSDRPAATLRDLCGDLRVNDADERSVIVPMFYLTVRPPYPLAAVSGPAGKDDVGGVF
jgi:hypothetical protein